MKCLHIAVMLACGAFILEASAQTYEIETKESANKESLFSSTFQPEASFGSALVDAAEIGDPITIRSLLSQGEDPNQRGKFEVTPLMRASFNGHTQIVQALIKAGANVDDYDLGGATALHIASREGHGPVAAVLIAAGAKPDVVDFEGWTPLMRASIYNHAEVVRVLLEAGVEVNRSNPRGETALTQAVKRRNEEIVSLLLAHGADATKQNIEGLSIVDVAKRRRNVNVLEKLLAAVEGGENKVIRSSDRAGGSEFFISVSEPDGERRRPDGNRMQMQHQAAQKPLAHVEHFAMEEETDAEANISVANAEESEPRIVYDDVIPAKATMPDELPEKSRFEAIEKDGRGFGAPAEAEVSTTIEVAEAKLKESLTALEYIKKKELADGSGNSATADDLASEEEISYEETLSAYLLPPSSPIVSKEPVKKSDNKAASKKPTQKRELKAAVADNNELKQPKPREAIKLQASLSIPEPNLKKPVETQIAAVLAQKLPEKDSREPLKLSASFIIPVIDPTLIQSQQASKARAAKNTATLDKVAGIIATIETAGIEGGALTDKEHLRRMRSALVSNIKQELSEEINLASTEPESLVIRAAKPTETLINEANSDAKRIADNLKKPVTNARDRVDYIIAKLEEAEVKDRQTLLRRIEATTMMMNPTSGAANVEIAEAIFVPESDSKPSNSVEYQIKGSAEKNAKAVQEKLWLRVGEYDSAQTATRHFEEIVSSKPLSGVRFEIVQEAPKTSKVSLKIGPVESEQRAEEICRYFQRNQLGCSTTKAG